MPAPKKIAPPSLYQGLEKEGIKRRENNDCGVKALAIVLDADYEEAQELLAKAGRDHGQGVYIVHMREALKYAGYRMMLVPIDQFVETHYPRSVRESMKSITTHHPDRYPQAWEGVERALLDVEEHMSAVRNGIVQDWTRSRRFKVKRLFLVKKIGDN